MSVFESMIPVEQRKAILEQRIQAFATEGWQHELNAANAAAIGDIAAVEVAEAAITQLATIIECDQAALETILTEVPVGS